MKEKVKKLWNRALHVGTHSGMDETQQVRLFVVNAFLLISFSLTVVFILTFVLLGSSSALEGIFFIPIIVFVFWLNAKGHYKVARVMVTYGLMLTTLLLAISDRRTGTEFILIAIGCCSVIVFEKTLAIIASFLFAFACYVTYILIDAYTPFTPDPSNPYLLIQNSIMFVSALAVVAQSMVFRSIIKKYAANLGMAHKEVQLVNEELKTSNEELASANEALSTLNTQLDWMVRQKSLELQSYLDAINIHLYSAVTDLNGTIIKVNKPLLEVSGYSNQEMVSNNFRILKSGYHTPDFYQNLHTCIQSGNTWRAETRNRAKDGSYFWIDQVILPVKNNAGELKYFLMLGLPITERKEMEEERLKTLKLLESIAFKTSHELRGPLARILGLTNLISLGVIKKEEMDVVTAQLKSSSRELDEATSDLTAFVNERHIALT